ncbi:MAG: SgcJ/EcaC family oxidoreductase [Planctomycetaceae bacterium]|nr:SgcJ/EcaC family oxidoreductase [Planctomycetaceae bacterium]
MASRFLMMVGATVFLSVAMVSSIGMVQAQENPFRKKNLPEKSASASDAEIRALLTTQKQAWNEGDLDRFMETYWKSPQLTFSSGGETTRGWQATLDRYKKKYATAEMMGQLEFENIEVQKLSTNVALVLGEWELTRKSDKPHGNFSLVLQRTDGVWRIVHDHSSLYEEKAPTTDQPTQDQSH